MDHKDKEIKDDHPFRISEHRHHIRVAGLPHDEERTHRMYDLTWWSEEWARRVVPSGVLLCFEVSEC